MMRPVNAVTYQRPAEWLSEALERFKGEEVILLWAHELTKPEFKNLVGKVG